MALKNYTSNSKNTFNNIQKILVEHKAKQVFFEYNDAGKIKTIAFSLEIAGVLRSFLLPARVENVEQIFLDNKKPKYDWQKAAPLTTQEKEQAYRTAWANIRDWLDAQMALIDTEQVKIEEVFLPYLATGKGRTLFDDYNEQKLLLPE